MIRTIFSVVVFTSLTAALSLKAEPTPTPKPRSAQKTKKEIAKVAPAKPLPLGWSLVNGVWMHSGGYKFVNGQVIRIGTQTHKRPPKPPTPAELNAAKKKTGPLSPADAAATKAAQKERNMAPRPASQTGTHL
jgi:hypothetical protein